ncbi:hypothetical protein GCM10011321_31950 [Youhaiella tibetensis]|uniref:Uncharacterized protein n=1 Tax=Paradevosia tibetensis TaxID=1447062 RepID=A0A5B9DKF2_9HYPH|nr:hypothetical protein [Youhaiella tibetensis]QEE18848.1 hypothetical protein FNA67_01035 [Youhaiella tibetensis]GGF38606.1 hypothetical protein GCM10011321_31950 [Youhaiella tibetensis]
MPIFGYEPTVNGLRVTIDGRPFGAGVRTPSEIDYQVGRLKNELDQLTAKMKRESPQQHKATFLDGMSDANRT